MSSTETNSSVSTDFGRDFESLRMLDYQDPGEQKRDTLRYRIS